MRKFSFIWATLWIFGLLGGIVRAESYQLTDGTTLTGDPVSFNETGMIVREAGDKYSDRVPWSKFSQEDLKKLAENPRITAFVDPFIEISPEERVKMTEVKINPVPRLARPAPQSLIGAMFSSSVGLFVLLVLYLANLYAAYEIAIFRARPTGLVCGVSAVAPVIGPIVFLSMPTLVERAEDTVTAPAGPAVIQPFATPPPGAMPAGLGRAPAAPAPAEPEAAAPGHGEELRLARPEPTPSASQTIPQTQSFKRGAFTFNRRFFETKFPGFFGIVRRDAEKDMVLLVISARGEYAAQRISRISANDLHLQVHKGAASEEVMVPFSEIQEIQLKHKDA